MALAERARQLSRGQDPQAFDALAAAYAALGEFAQAARVGVAGIEVALASGQQSLAAEMRDRVLLYEQRQAFLR